MSDPTPPNLPHGLPPPRHRAFGPRRRIGAVALIATTLAGGGAAAQGTSEPEPPPPVAASVEVGAPVPASPPADPVPVARRAFHSFCPFAVAHPSVTLLSTDAAWRAALAQSPIQPPPYAAADLDTSRHRLFIVAGPTTPGPTASMALAPGPRAVAYGAAAQRLSARVVFSDPPPAPGLLGAAVVGQPCLVLWIDLQRPVREVVARTTEGRVLGVVRAP